MRCGRRAVLITLLALAAWEGLARPLAAQLASSTSLQNAGTGMPLGGAVAMDGDLAGGTPDDEPVSWLQPLIRYELTYLALALFPPDVYLKAQGDLTSPYGTIPLARLTWDGVGIDGDGSTWTATGSAFGPTNQAIATSFAKFGTSPILRTTFHYDMRYRLANSWLTPYGTYGTTLTYGVQEGLGAMAPTDLAVSIDVPARLAVSVPATSFDLTADPLDPAPATPAVSALLKSNARSTETTMLTLRATPLSNGTDTLPVSAFTCKAGTGAPVALSAADQTVASVAGATAGTAVPLTFQVQPSWAFAPGRYTSTVTYTAVHSAGVAPPQSGPATAIAVDVPARLWIGVNTESVSLVADPGDSGPENVAAGAAAVTVRSNYGQARVLVAATPPSAGGAALPGGAFQYQLSQAAPPVGGDVVRAAVAVDAGGAWTALPTTSSPTATFTGRTDGAVLTFDYRVLRSWLYKGATYTSTVTYTVVGL